MSSFICVESLTSILWHWAYVSQKVDYQSGEIRGLNVEDHL